MSTSLFIVIFFITLVSALIYLKIADKYNIIDKPNERSSHTKITIRGIGVIIPIALISSYLIFDFQSYVFVFGFAVATLVGFLDDIVDLNSIVRIILYALATYLMLYDFGLLGQFTFVGVLIFVVTLGVSNAFNFMDGINGMCVLYSLITLASLFVIGNLELKIFDYEINVSVIAICLALIVLLFFNFRKNALAFIGDAGSITLGLFCASLVLLLIYQTGQLAYILLLLVYGIDSVGTILYRLLKRENIFTAHRLHAYQKFSNEKKWGHLKVSITYAMFQLVINLSLFYCLKSNISLIPVALAWFGVLFGTYIWIRKSYFNDLSF